MTDLAPAPTLPRSRAIPVDVVDPFSIGALRDRGGATALIVDRGARRTEVSYAELAERVERRGVELGRRRRLVALRAHNDVESIVTLLAALDRGHPLIMTDGSSSASNDPVLQRYAPDTVVSVRDGHAAIDHHTAIDRGSRHRLHDDLALLMSTSGTTGGSKLVRLSADGVRSNARAIASALELTEHDRAIASLPLHYCYGLSVVTSHLAVGGSFVLTPASVVDPCFWRAIERDAVTTLAGVPYTFEMIQRLGLDVLRAPSLRIVTQAGGRLDPADVRRFAGLGREAGWSFSVMYGQTEATARMAVSRPGDASTSPHTVGHAIPGGSFRIVQPNREGIGEVVYRGPNVMMGYADTPSDLALGRVIDELRTGDLGRLDDRGRLELVGRVSRNRSVPSQFHFATS